MHGEMQLLEIHGINSCSPVGMEVTLNAKSAALKRFFWKRKERKQEGKTRLGTTSKLLAQHQSKIISSQDSNTHTSISTSCFNILNPMHNIQPLHYTSKHRILSIRESGSFFADNPISEPVGLIGKGFSLKMSRSDFETEESLVNM